jgi:hypothetical protein
MGPHVTRRPHPQLEDHDVRRQARPVGRPQRPRQTRKQPDRRARVELAAEDGKRQADGGVVGEWIRPHQQPSPVEQLDHCALDDGLALRARDGNHARPPSRQMGARAMAHECDACPPGNAHRRWERRRAGFPGITNQFTSRVVKMTQFDELCVPASILP